MTYFKVLNGYKPTNGGKGRYPGVGRWTKHLDPDHLEACAVGYHLADATQLLSWLGPTIYEAEPCPDHEIVDGHDKWVTCRVRLTRKLSWDDRKARLYAADVAESVLLGERASGREPDGRSWNAVAVARRFVDGEATRQELKAAWEGAWAAVRDAETAARDARDARVAARDAARAAAWAATRDAAWAAARDAARDAAWAAARAASWDAEAARAASWDAEAAKDARDAAWVAALKAARDAAWAAAWVAARHAALAELSNRLLDYLYDQPIPGVSALYGESQ